MVPIPTQSSVKLYRLKHRTLAVMCTRKRQKESNAIVNYLFLIRDADAAATTAMQM